MITKITQHEGFVKGVCWDPVGEYLATQVRLSFPPPQNLAPHLTPSTIISVGRQVGQDLENDRLGAREDGDRALL